jgi:hypothetical protein
MELAMECNEAQELISEYIDKRLDPKTTETINGHLSACSNCRVKAERLSQTNRLFASLPQVEPPVGFTTRLMAHVQEEAAKPNLWKWLSLPFQIGVPLQATAVVLVAVVAVFLYQKERPLERSTPVGDAGRELSRVGGEQTIDHQLVVRLRAPAHDEKADRSKSATSVFGRFSSLSQVQVENFEKAGERAVQTGQSQNELLSIPRDQYEQFKKELVAIGDIEADPGRASQKSESSATKSDPLLIMVTIVPPTQRPAR